MRLTEAIRVGITGTDHMYEALADRLSAYFGVEIVRAARSAVVPCGREALDAELCRLDSYHWIVFTSRNAVDLFFEATRQQSVDPREFERIRFAVVGTGTGTYLERFGFQASCMPEAFTTEALAQKLCEAVGPGERLLMPRAKQGSKILTAILTEAGISHTDLPIYDIETTCAPMDVLMSLSFLTFESGSGVRGFFAEDAADKRKLLNGPVIPVCIGPVTRDVLAQYGVTRCITAEEYTVDGLLAALQVYIGPDGPGTQTASRRFLG